ncbi:MAG: 50S ribosomal protein L21 [Cyanobacteria bacterium P01_A01_bin.17]
MAYAIVEIGGTQLWVEPGRFYDVNRLHHDVDAKMSIDKVLLVHDGTEVSVGQPLVKGATVEVTVLRHMRDRKVIVYKMQPKKKTRKKRGHRQELTRFMVDSIQVNGTAVGGEAKKKAPAKSAKVDEEASEKAPAKKAKAKKEEAPTEA